MARFHSFTTETAKVPDEFDSYRKAPTPENREKVFEWLRPTVSSAMTSFAAGDKSLEPRAWILTAEALDAYDPEKGAGIKTHVYNHLKRLNRIRMERYSVMHVPENVRSDATSIQDFVREYMDEKGVEPSQAMIAERMKMSLKRVRKALGHGETTTTAMTTEKGDASAGTKRRDPSEIWMDYVYHDLSETDKKILEGTTGYGGSVILPKTEIARRLRISPAAVSLRISKIQAKLQEVLK